jgi:very-short-patch-repair endonuclease
VSSVLEDLFAAQLDACGLTGYVREYQAIPARKFRFDFCFKRERLLIEINGGTYNGGAHGRG